MRKHEDDYKFWVGESEPTDADKEIHKNLSAKARKYPLTEQEFFPVMAEAMFLIPQLPQAWDYFIHHRTKPIQADTFYRYIYRLEKDVALNQQRTQPDSI